MLSFMLNRESPPPPPSCFYKSGWAGRIWCNRPLSAPCAVPRACFPALYIYVLLRIINRFTVLRLFHMLIIARHHRFIAQSHELIEHFHGLGLQSQGLIEHCIGLQRFRNSYNVCCLLYS